MYFTEIKRSYLFVDNVIAIATSGTYKKHVLTS